jgi:hypothetical protein
VVKAFDLFSQPAKAGRQLAIPIALTIRKHFALDWTGHHPEFGNRKNPTIASVASLPE